MKTPITALILMAAALFSACTNATPPAPEANPHWNELADYGRFCDGVFQLCGLKNWDTGDVKIVPTYQTIYRYSEGLAAAKENGKYGFLDETGDWQIAPQFDSVSGFEYGMAIVEINGLRGTIDRTGVFIIEPQFAEALILSAEILIARNPEQQKSPKPRFNHPNISIGNNGKYGSIRSFTEKFDLYKGRLHHIEHGWITDQNMLFKRFTEEAPEFVWASPEHMRKKFGLLKLDGNWALPLQFKSVRSLYENRALVKNADDKWGAVSEAGVIAIEPQFDHLRHFEFGYSQARNGKYGNQQLHSFIGKDGNLAGDRFFDQIELPTEDFLPRVRDGDVWRSVGKNGKLIDDQREGTIRLACEGSVSFKQVDGKLAALDRDGKRITDVLLTPAFNYLSSSCDGPIYLHGPGDTPAFITLDGRYVLASDVKDEAIISTDKDGNPLPEEAPRKTRDELAKQRLSCKGGARRVTKDGLWGLLGPNDEAIIPIKHHALSCYRNGEAFAPHPTRGTWCPIGPSGEFLPEAKLDADSLCAQTLYPYKPSHHSPERLSDDPFESSILWYAAYLELATGKRDTGPRSLGDGISARGYSHDTLDW